MQRRTMICSSLAAAISAASAKSAALKIGHRQANMIENPGPEVFDLARKIAGLSGVELQIQYKGTSLWDRDTLQSYKQAAQRTGLAVPSLAGIWKPGATIMQPAPAAEHLSKAIQAAEAIGAKVILVACFDENCPRMDDERSYAPVVSVLQKAASAAADAGVVLAMETSLSPADDRKLIDLVNRPALRVYYDLDNVERFGHTGLSVPGVEVLGKARIAQVHVKNEDRLLEQPGRVNWAAALQAIKKTGYNGWFVFESSHTGAAQCVEATQKNIEFIKRQFA